jgi:hypothetical protein
MAAANPLPTRGESPTVTGELAVEPITVADDPTVTPAVDGT